MYPHSLIFDIGLYELLAAGGILCAMVMFRHLSNALGLTVRLHNFILANTVVTIIGGYFAAVLFQAFYDWRETGIFKLDQSTGATFLGGFVGGLVIFLSIYFIGGHFLFERGYMTKIFPTIADIFAVCLPLAHGFGRIGCLMAGCCHGSEASWGIYHVNIDKRVVPVQLFEALFLFALCTFLYFFIKKFAGSGFAAYLALYGVWRFFAEFMRADDRGEIFGDLLSPSQYLSILLVVVGASMLLVKFIMSKRRRS